MRRGLRFSNYSDPGRARRYALVSNYRRLYFFEILRRVRTCDVCGERIRRGGSTANFAPAFAIIGCRARRFALDLTLPFIKPRTVPLSLRPCSQTPAVGASPGGIISATVTSLANSRRELLFQDPVLTVGLPTVAVPLWAN